MTAAGRRLPVLTLQLGPLPASTALGLKCSPEQTRVAKLFARIKAPHLQLGPCARTAQRNFEFRTQWKTVHKPMRYDNNSRAGLVKTLMAMPMHSFNMLNK